ncbi:hypothetical protein KAU88_06545 [Candidatus Bathyarchaeota archaeon]|nr:hypothetical protein [Candidatus Bathyarchaeota archaeon]
MTALLCKLGFHRWRDYGERVLLIWKEPGLLPGTKQGRRKHVFSERGCLRCGIKEKRKFSENVDGTLAAAGWEIVEESKAA